MEQITKMKRQRTEVMMVGWLPCVVEGITTRDSVVLVVVAVADAKMVVMNGVKARGVIPGHTIVRHAEIAMHPIAR